MSFAVLVIVGPGDREVERLRDLADALAAHEPGPAWFAMVDDAPTPRPLDRLVPLPPAFTPVALHHARRHRGHPYRWGKGICSALMTGLKWVAETSDATFTLKLDTDSLIIAPFAERLDAFFAADPDCAIVGAHLKTPNGTRRDFAPNAAALRGQLGSPLLRRLLGRRDDEPLALLRGTIARARAGRLGYALGEHCMGGGYTLSRSFLERLLASGALDDPLKWERIDTAEDVLIGMHVRALGFTLRDSVDAGEIFGVRYQGLPFPPEELVRRRYSVIHAVKNDPHIDEASIRAFFKARRPASDTAGGVGDADP